jgi:hypothetical protein
MVLTRIGICLALVGVLSVSAFAQQPASSNENAEAIAAAMKCLDDFMTALNARNLKAFEGTMNFPHVRLNGANLLKVFASGEMKEAVFDNLEAKGWDHSAWQKRQVVSAGPNKVHIQTRFVRYRADSSVLSAYDSLYVVTKENGHWGIRMRSSFAY